MSGGHIAQRTVIVEIHLVQFLVSLREVGETKGTYFFYHIILCFCDIIIFVVYVKYWRKT